MSTPLSHWLGFHAALLFLLAAEFLLERHARKRPGAGSPGATQRIALVTTLAWVAAALLFAAFIFRTAGPHATTEYLAGYAIEQALSVDNLFVFLLLFGAFRIAPENQPRVLFWGVAGAILMRGLFIALGIGLLQRFEWISYAFGAFLLVGAIRLLRPATNDNQPPRWLRWLSRLHPISLRQDRFFVLEDGRRMATVLALALVAIELTDVVFALDSIPAVLSITRHPFLAYTSNIMAVMGLRSLFFVLAHLLTRLRFLHFGLAAVLAFAALKMLLAPWLTVGPIASLATIVALLSATVALSLARPGPSTHPS